MTMYTLIIDTIPPQQYPVADLESVTVSGTGETQNQTITLDNGRGQHTARLVPAPLAIAARLVSNGATVLQGRIRAITLGASIRVEIEP